MSEMFLAPQDLRRPFNAEWSSAKPILPGQEQTLEKPGHSRRQRPSPFWAGSSSRYAVKYEDGTSWRAQSEGECFSVIWRDQQHPDLPALPPRQIEMNPD